MVAYEAPGVYYQTVDAGAPEVTPLRTDIVGFVGIAARGPIDMPVPVQSWRQFASWFGSFTAYAYLAYAVREETAPARRPRPRCFRMSRAMHGASAHRVKARGETR